MFPLATVLEGILGEGPEIEAQLDLSFRDVVVDPSAVGDGVLFVHLSEEDQGDVVAEAVARGATGIMLEAEVALRQRGSKLDLRGTPPKLSTNGLETPVWLIVEDARAGLEKLSIHWRDQHAVKVITAMGQGTERPAAKMTGSVLEQRHVLLQGVIEGGDSLVVPLTLLKLRSKHDRVILTASHQIEQVASFARPTVVLVTDSGTYGRSGDESKENFTEKAAEILKALPADGTAILNSDDAELTGLVNETRARVVTYGLGSERDLWANDVESLGVEGTSFWLRRDEKRLKVRIPYFGRPAVHSALAAAAVGVVEGLPLGEVVAGLQALPAQVQVLTKPGPRDAVLIDDTYGASPDSCIAALNLVAELDGRKVAVFGALTSFEEDEERGYERVGGRAAQVADIVVAIGEAGRRIGEEALARGQEEQGVFFADDNADAVRQLRSLLETGDQVLVKGAKELGMEEIAATLAIPSPPAGEEA